MVILLVEDEENVAQFVKNGLENEQFTVELAKDGEEAMSKLSIYDYDLVILDVMLPKKDGFQVCHEIRAMGLTLPVLMLTAKDLTKDRVAGLEEGADDYLVKPFVLSELVARIRALLRRSKEIIPSKLAVGDLEIDTSSHEVRRRGELLNLTSKEYRILEYLMRHAGMVCSRTMINEHVWGFNYVKSNIIDVYISRLRTKVDGSFGTKLIHTVHSSGYKLKEPVLQV